MKLRAPPALFLVALALAACPRTVPLPRTPEIVARLRAALRAGDTVALFELGRDVFRRHGVEFDPGLSLRVHGPGTLSSYYVDETNEIVLAAAARPGEEGAQLRSLSTALFYANEGLPKPGVTPAERAELLNLMVLLLATHEQAHYLRAQYFGARDDGNHWRAEAICNRLGAAAVRFLANADAEIAAGLGRVRTFFGRLLARAPPAVADYPPPGEPAAEWFDRHYELLLRNEPGVYFVFQLRWWLEYLSGPDEPLDRLLETEVRAAARRYLARVSRAPLRVRVRTQRVVPGRVPSEVLALGPGGEILLDADGRLLRGGGGGGEARVYRSRRLPYGDGYVSNYATWPAGREVYAFRWEQGLLTVYRVDLEESSGEARPQVLATFEVPHPVTTISHDPEGLLYFLARAPRELWLYRLDARSGDWSLSRRLPARPPGHADGPALGATYQVGAFAVDRAGALVFYDPAAFALRQIDEDGDVSTLAGTFRGFRDGSGRSARLSRASHLAAFPDGFYFVEDKRGALAVRRTTVRSRWKAR